MVQDFGYTVKGLEHRQILRVCPACILQLLKVLVFAYTAGIIPFFAEVDTQLHVLGIVCCLEIRILNIIFIFFLSLLCCLGILLFIILSLLL